MDNKGGFKAVEEVRGSANWRTPEPLNLIRFPEDDGESPPMNHGAIKHITK